MPKRVDDLSFASVTLYFANSLLWLAYGLLIAAWPVAVANALALVISIVQLSLKLKYTLQPSPIVQIGHAAAWVADLERALTLECLSRQRGTGSVELQVLFSLSWLRGPARADDVTRRGSEYMRISPCRWAAAMPLINW